MPDKEAEPSHATAISHHTPNSSEHEAVDSPNSPLAAMADSSYFVASNVMRRAKTNPGSLTPGNILALQRTIGNQAVMRLLAHKKEGKGFTAVKHIQKPLKSPIPRSSNSIVQRWERFESQALPLGGNSKFPTLQEVHFTYVSAKRATHTQLHLTFSDSDTPEAGETRKTSSFVWYNTQTQSWSLAGKNPCDDGADIEWYKTEALKWGKAKETEYLQTIPAHARPLNEFTNPPALPVVVAPPPVVVAPPKKDDGFTVVGKGGKPK